MVFEITCWGRRFVTSYTIIHPLQGTWVKIRPLIRMKSLWRPNLQFQDNRWSNRSQILTVSIFCTNRHYNKMTGHWASEHLYLPKLALPTVHSVTCIRGMLMKKYPQKHSFSYHFECLIIQTFEMHARLSSYLHVHLCLLFLVLYRLQKVVLEKKVNTWLMLYILVLVYPKH